MFASPEKTTTVYTLLSEIYASPRVALTYHNPFTLLISVLLSAQTTDVSVNKITPLLFQEAPTPESMLSLGYDRLYAHIRPVGLAPSKTTHILGLCQRLIERYNGTVPESRTALMTLPGVGKKTASVVMNVAFGYPYIAVDTHVFRVSKRLGLVDPESTSPERVQNELERATPLRFKKLAHLLFILHGRTTCTARKPNCNLCPLRSLCLYYASAVHA